MKTEMIVRVELWWDETTSNDPSHACWVCSEYCEGDERDKLDNYELLEGLRGLKLNDADMAIQIAGEYYFGPKFDCAQQDRSDVEVYDITPSGC